VQRGIATDLRWTWIFGTILILVVVVVIGFLSGITSALNSIDKALGTTDATLTDVGGDADPLPGYIQKINGNLTDIDKALKPIPQQASDILASLTSINGSTGRVNAALGNTSSSLLSTSGSLVDTTGTLQTISGSLVDTSNSLPARHLGRAGHRRKPRSDDQRPAAAGALGREPGYGRGRTARDEHQQRCRPGRDPLRHAQDQRRPDRCSQPPDEHLQVDRDLGAEPARRQRQQVLTDHAA
jgi:hypothetical protein